PPGRGEIGVAEREPHTRQVAQSEVDLALRSLPDQKDRRILSLWLGGQGHDAIAGDVGLSTVAVRKRWQMIKQRLRSFFEAES
ncbi:MAG TPA: hypothetical protein PK400_09290, partial [Phycisphaerales bacterium]|nr:hypothetical protein [Phycisphaerales bacterium]